MRFLPAIFIFAAGCSQLQDAAKSPVLTPPEQGQEYLAMTSPLSQFNNIAPRGALESSSLWNGGPQSLLGDRRALLQGDILTVVIEIDDNAEISNTTSRTRSGSETVGIASFLGIPERLNTILPDGASLDPAISTNSSSNTAGDGSVRRKEKLTLRVAATITEVLPNGILRITGSQEVQVNFEIRELLVSGFIRPKDISRQNEITYDKIASARISYGGRGLISDAQQPRYGQRIIDKILPF